MKRSTVYRWVFLLALVGLLEVLCLTGVINKITMQPPHKIATDLFAILKSGSLNSAILKTFANAGTAFLLAMSAGVVFGASCIGRGCSARSSTRCSRPITRSRFSLFIRC